MDVLYNFLDEDKVTMYSDISSSLKFFNPPNNFDLKIQVHVCRCLKFGSRCQCSLLIP